MQSSSIDTKLLNGFCLLVDNLDFVSHFFTQVFENCTIESNDANSIKYSIVRISSIENNGSILLIQKSSCSATQMDYFRNVCTSKLLFVVVKDPAKVLKNALAVGGQVVESCTDDNGSIYCAFDGPENIMFKVMNPIRSRRLSVFEMILSSALDADDQHQHSQSHSQQQGQALPRIRSMSPPRAVKRAPRAPRIPTLDVSILSNGVNKEYVPCPANSREPIPFETELFKGTALLVVRTKPPDNHFDPFFNGPKKRMFEVQVQGKFKRMPIGEMYCGAEAANKMELGIFTRSISKAACNFCATMVKDLHYSFGDNQSQPNYEVPHIVAPLFPTLDKIIITPPGAEPPPLGLPFVEDLDYRKQRLQYRQIDQANIDLETTYSFSVNTSNLDLQDWTLMGIPMVKPMDLRSFFGDSSLNLVAYEIPRSVLQQHPNCHPMKHLNYAFNIKLTALDPEDKSVDLNLDYDNERLPSDVEDVDGGDDDFGRPTSPSLSLSTSAVSAAVGATPGTITTPRGTSGAYANPHSATVGLASGTSAADTVGGDDFIDDEEDEEEEEEGFINFDVREEDMPDGADAKRSTGKSLSKSRFLPSSKGEGGTTVGSWFRRRIDDMTPDSLDVPETSELIAADYEMEATGELRYCPMSIDTNDHRLMGRRRTLYLVPWPDPASSSLSSANNTTGNASLIARIRPYSELSKAMPLVPIPRLHKNKKMSSEEKKRRQIVESYKSLLVKNSQTQLAQANSLLAPQNDFDKTFLDNSTTNLQKVKSKSGNDKYEGGVAMATAPRSWSEQFIKLSKTELAIYRGSEAARASHVIQTTSIFCVRPMRLEETPLHLIASHASNFAFFQLETFARVFYFMVREKQLIEWLNAFIAILGPSIVHLTSTETVPPDTIAGSDEAYVAKPSTWRLDKRRIFNYRRIIFNVTGLPASVREKSPGELVEDMLSNAFSLAAAEAVNTALPRQWISFLDKITILQILDFSKLNETERSAFLLNLYHLMILHGSLIIGPPPSWASWQAFFSTSYLLLFDIVSIAEIEHNMLRACMSRPSPLLSKIRAPNSLFPGLALSHRDFRLNFCINSGSHSLPDTVPIYKAETLDRQLDETTLRYLSDVVKIDSQRRLIILPKVCSWFPADFSMKRNNSAATPIDCLWVIAPYVKPESRATLIRLLSDGTNPSVRFKNFNFRCKVLAQYSPSSPQVSASIATSASTVGASTVSSLNLPPSAAVSEGNPHHGSLLVSGSDDETD